MGLLLFPDALFFTARPLHTHVFPLATWELLFVSGFPSSMMLPLPGTYFPFCNPTSLTTQHKCPFLWEVFLTPAPLFCHSINDTLLSGQSNCLSALWAQGHTLCTVVPRRLNKRLRHRAPRGGCFMETVTDSTWFSWTPKSLLMVTAATKLKDACSLEEKLWQT